MIQTKTLTLSEIEDLAMRALVAAGTSEANARPLAVATAATEADGVASHGLAYIPIYCEHVGCGKVDGQARPVLTHPRPAALHVDAATGFAHPAIDLGFEQLIPLARDHGIAILNIHDSYNCGVLGYHTHRLAAAGLVGLGFTNAPASIAPSGGARPVIGTNPFSLATPGGGGEVDLLIDQSASTIAKSEVMKHAREDRPIPVGWALDPDGNPTTDPNVGLKGSIAPSGGYKGVGGAFGRGDGGGAVGGDARQGCGPVFGHPGRAAQDRAMLHRDPSRRHQRRPFRHPHERSHRRDPGAGGCTSARRRAARETGRGQTIRHCGQHRHAGQDRGDPTLTQRSRRWRCPTPPRRMRQEEEDRHSIFTLS